MSSVCPRSSVFIDKSISGKSSRGSYSMRKFIIISIAFHIVLSLISEPRAAGPDEFSFSLSPQLVELELSPGEKRAFSISLINEGKKKGAKFKVYISDLGEHRSGKYRVLDEEKSGFSAAGWITVSDKKLSIGPNDGKDIFAEVRVPRGVVGGHYAIIVFELVPEGSSSAQRFGSLTLRHRMTTAVEITIKGRRAKRRADITSLKTFSEKQVPVLKKYGKDTLLFTASLKNEGNIHIFGEGTLTIRNKKGGRVKQVPLGGGRGTVLPESTVDFSSIVKRDFGPGDYVAEAVIRYGGYRPARAKLNFSVTEKETKPIIETKSFRQGKDIGFEVTPHLVEINSPPGALRSNGIVVHNRDEKAIEIWIYARALRYNRYGELVRLASAKGSYSCGEWLTITPSNFTLPPGGKKGVRILARVPEGVSGGRYANIVVDARMPSKNPGTTLRTFSNTPLFLTIDGSIKQRATVGKVDVSEAAKGGYRRMSLSFRNTGNVHLKPGGKVSIERAIYAETPEGAENVGKPDYDYIDSIPFKEIENPVLPGERRDMVATYFSPLVDGEYRAVAEVGYGDKKRVVRRDTFAVASVVREKVTVGERKTIFTEWYKRGRNFFKGLIKKDDKKEDKKEQ